MEQSRTNIDDSSLRDRFATKRRSTAYVRRPAVYSRVVDINAPVVHDVSPDIVQVQQVTPTKPPVIEQKVVAPQPARTAPSPSPAVTAAVQAIEQPVAEPPKSKRKRQKSTIALYAMATFLLIVGLAVSANGFLVNRHVSATVAHLSTTKNTTNDEETPPSTTKPTDTDINTYAVAPNLARYITIPKIAVKARVLSMGVTSSNRLKAPGNVYDAGWYNGSSLPGQPGAMLVDGHISSWTTHGVFYGINKLVAGDEIDITRGDGKILAYQVVKSEIKPSDQVDMSSLLVSQDTAKPGLNLISCSGDVIPGTNEFDKRIVVYATLKS